LQYFSGNKSGATVSHFDTFDGAQATGSAPQTRRKPIDKTD
jgi:hypothetical protein